MKRALMAAMVIGAMVELANAGLPPVGPRSPYYLTAGEQGMDWVVQGNSVIANWPQVHKNGVGEYAISVCDTVHVLGSSYGGTTTIGSEYTLNGIPTGTDYPYPPVPKAAFWDATTTGADD